MDEEQNYLHGTVRSNPLGCPLTNFGTGDSETLQIDSDTGTEIREDWYLSENIPYPSRRDNQKNREKASYQKEKIFQMFQDLRFDISFADALFFSAGDLLLRLGNLLMNKERRSEEKFLIPCEFPGMEICYALADLGASINLMPLLIWKKLSLPELSPTRMSLELADQSITYPKGLAEDVYVKVGKFYFPADFVVVDFEADPRVPLILGRGSELLGFPSDDFSTCNPTSTSEPFTLEEIDAFLYDKSFSLESDHDDCDPKEDIYVLEQLLNDDPFQLPPMDLKQSEVTEANLH
ncbi:reverse transcriptase domain-containing protein [Tanacetum coccineum]